MNHRIAVPSFLILVILMVTSQGCDLTSPSEYAFDFLQSFQLGTILSETVVGYNFIDNFSKGRILPNATIGGTPNGKPVFVLTGWDIGGIRRDAIVTTGPSTISFDAIKIQPGSYLEFGVGMQALVGDGCNTFIFIESAGAKDTLFTQYINPRDSVADRRWYDYSIKLARYEGKTIRLTFAADMGPRDDNSGDWVGWSGPILKFQAASSTSTGKGVIVIKRWNVGEEPRDAMITLAGSQITFNLPADRGGEVLFFGVGMNTLAGDGAKGVIQVEADSKRDTVYQRFLNPALYVVQRKWFDESVNLSVYRNKPIKITFSAHPGSAGDYSGDWFGWSMPILSLPRR
ncbi:MAG: hypothetical protein V1799_21735 [bacterium]